MKIEKGYNQYVQSIRRTQTEQAKESSNESSVRKPTSSDTVHISPEAKVLSEATTPKEISPRAQEIKKALESGTYPVSAKEIAKGILQAVRQQKGMSDSNEH